MSTTANELLISADLSHSDLCSVLVEWECRRRGARIDRVGRLLFIATLDGVSVPFQRSVGPGVAVPSERITRAKQATRLVLRDAGLSVPDGVRLQPDDLTKALDFASDRNFEVVVKPAGSAGGAGVVTEIDSREALEQAWDRLAASRLARSGIIVEDRLHGHDYRLFVVDGVVIAALSRRPAQVTGDGTSTIKQLIDAKNQARSANPDLKGRPVKVDFIVRQNLERAGFSLESVLPEGRILHLRKAANLSKGGESLDVTDSVHPRFRQVAIDAIAAIPGALPHCTVDLISPSIETDPATTAHGINELEGDPGMGIHHYPSRGTPRDVARAIVGYYFPGDEDVPDGYAIGDRDDEESLRMLRETLALVDQHPRRAPLRSRRSDASAADDEPGRPGQPSPDPSSADAPPPTQREALRLIVHGDVQGVGYRDWITQQATDLGIDGWVRNRIVRTVEIVAAGDQDRLEELVRLSEQGPPDARVTKVDQRSLRAKISQGFSRKRRVTR